MKFADKLRQLKPGERFETEKTKAVCYVTAKRCGLSIEVTEKDGQRIVKLAGSRTDDLIARLKSLSTSDRLLVFESFELCCGQNRGQCICEPEPIQVPIIEKKSVLNALQAKIDAIQSGVSTPVVEVEPDWKFTKQAPQFADNGNVYRQQFRVSNGKPVYRNVEVDCDDIDELK